MSESGHKRSFCDSTGMSAPGGRADVFRQNADIRISMSDCRGRPAGCVGGGRRGINPTPMADVGHHGCPTGRGGVLWCAPRIVDGPRHRDCRPIPVFMMLNEHLKNEQLTSRAQETGRRHGRMGYRANSIRISDVRKPRNAPPTNIAMPAGGVSYTCRFKLSTGLF